MRRREFIAGLGSVGALPVAVRAQQEAVQVIGFLDAGSLETRRDVVEGVYGGLAAAGYVVGRNLTFEYRWAEDHLERLPALAADLVRRQVAVIVTPGSTQATLAAKAASGSIPIGDLEKLLWPSVASIFGVNSTESEGEQTGIIREKFRAADERC